MKTMWVPEQRPDANAIPDHREQTVTVETMSARVFADAQRSFASRIDSGMLQQHVNDVVADLWTNSPKITTFIPVLALRDLRERLGSGSEPSRA